MESPLDGVYVREDHDGALVFHPLPAPTRREVTEVARRSAQGCRRPDLAPSTNRTEDARGEIVALL